MSTEILDSYKLLNYILHKFGAQFPPKMSFSGFKVVLSSYEFSIGVYGVYYFTFSSSALPFQSKKIYFLFKDLKKEIMIPWKRKG